MKQVVSLVVVLLLSVGTAFGQEEWHTFTSLRDRFSVLLPTEPTVKDIVWETEYGGKLPAHVYTVKQGATTYSATVVDYNPLQAQQIAKATADCKPGSTPKNGDEVKVREGCAISTSARRTDRHNGVGYWKNDTRGAITNATFRYLQRENVKVTYYMWNYLGAGPEGYELQLLNTADKSRTFVAMYMHQNWLYILESTSPGNAAPPLIFQQSISLLMADGSRASYDHVYVNSVQVDPTDSLP
jgi:hypothetical protein